MEFGDVMDAVATVVGVALVGGDGDQLVAFGAFADTEDSEGVVGQLEGFFEGGFVESADDEGVETHFDGTEGHGFERHAEVDEGQLVVADGGADDDEGLRFGARERKVELGEGGAHLDVGEDLGGTGVFGDELETEHLTVAAGAEFGIDGDDLLEFFATDDIGGVVAARGAVAEEELVEGVTYALGDFLGSEDFFVAFFQIIVCHGLLFFFKGYVIMMFVLGASLGRFGLWVMFLGPLTALGIVEGYWFAD